jgi:hypothetical protein
VVRLKHAESGGFITIDDQSKIRNGLQEAYVRVYSGLEPEENMTSNQLFEAEKMLDDLDRSGSPFFWEF